MLSNYYYECNAICIVDRVRTSQRSMHLTAARFRYQLHCISIGAPQTGVHRRLGRVSDGKT